MKIVITDGYRWNYFQWFLLGLQMLNSGAETVGREYSFKLRLPFIKRLTFSNNHYMAGVGRKLMRKFCADSYNMDGYIILDDGAKKTFTIDSADAPFLFDEEKLKNVDVYFKMQCPNDLDAAGFSLSGDVTIPWCDHVHVDPTLILTQRSERKVISDLKQYKDKIKPLMVGPRSLSRENGYVFLKKGYENYIKEQTTHKQAKLMCYFGNALGPKPETDVSVPDWDWEADIMGYYKGMVDHPNEKRAKAAEMIGNIKNYETDARVISIGNADAGEKIVNSQIVPLEDFCRHISRFQYNLNISGYRMSIPNRFVESFMVGTAVITDKLVVRWYRPFGSEILETVEMGYLRNGDVDWEAFGNLLTNLPDSKPDEVIKAYREKWCPEAAAEYIIRTLESADAVGSSPKRKAHGNDVFTLEGGRNL